MAPIFLLHSRALETEGATSQSSMSGIIIAGIVVACVLVLGVAAWLGIRYYRKRSSAAREDQLGSGFLAVRGIIKEGQQSGPTSK